MTTEENWITAFLGMNEEDQNDVVNFAKDMEKLTIEERKIFFRGVDAYDKLKRREKKWKWILRIYVVGISIGFLGWWVL